MKGMSSTIITISLILLLSGCSQGYRSNAKQILHSNQHAIEQAQENKKITHVIRPRTQEKSLPRASSHLPKKTQKNTFKNQKPTRNLMTRIAQSTLGKPYKWGGSSPQQGFDCSGLMRYIHKNALGIQIPRTAAQQRDKSRTISYAQLQPGDMLFFRTGKSSNHVGVYVGDRKFIHAATGSKQVKVASMDSSYWHKRFVKFGTFL